MSVEPLPVLPFHPMFHALVRDGRKTATSRAKRYGKPGDLVQGPGVVLRLLDVQRLTLGRVPRDHWQEEGVESPEAFVAIWRELHPVRGYQPDDLVWLHLFEVTQTPRPARARDPLVPSLAAFHDARTLGKLDHAQAPRMMPPPNTSPNGARAAHDQDAGGEAPNS